MKKYFLILTVVFTVTVTHGQTKTETTKEEQPYIEVTGTAEKEVIPDEIYIKITIREKYVGKEKMTIEKQEEKLKTALKEIGVDLANLSLSDANADFIKVSWTKKDVLTKKEYSLKVSNATTVGQVFQQLDKLEITGAYISKVAHSKIDSLKKEVKIMAMKAAKEKADYLLASIGEQTGKPLVVREKEYTEEIPFNQLNIRGGRSNIIEYSIPLIDSKDKDEDEIQFQKIKIQFGIYAKFAIK